jgi:hypothetical protein
MIRMATPEGTRSPVAIPLAGLSRSASSGAGVGSIAWQRVAGP